MMLGLVEIFYDVNDVKPNNNGTFWVQKEVKREIFVNPKMICFLREIYGLTDRCLMRMADGNDIELEGTIYENMRRINEYVASYGVLK